jgi:hypothetical protein
MRRNEWMSVATVAACTCLLALAAGWPRSLVANEEVAQPQPEMPKLEVDGVQVAVTAGDKALAEGKKIELQLTATNQSDEPREVTFDCTLMSPGEVSPMSRMPAVMSKIWSEQVVLKLEPGQTVTRTLKTDQDANPKADYTAFLKAGQQQVAGWSHSGMLAALAPVNAEARARQARSDQRARGRVAVNRATNGQVR